MIRCISWMLFHCHLIELYHFNTIRNQKSPVILQLVMEKCWQWWEKWMECKVAANLTDFAIFALSSVQFSSVAQSCPTFTTPWIAACQASLSITNSRSLLKLMSIESVMPSSHLILCRPFLLLPSIPPSIRIFSNESTLCMRWPKC